MRPLLRPFLLRTPPSHLSKRHDLSSIITIRMTSTLPRLPIFKAIAKHDLTSPAIIHNPSGRAFTYGELVHDVADAIDDMKEKADKQKTPALAGERVAFLVENGYDYVVTLLSIFANNAIAVPLCTTFPNHELRYIIDHSEAAMLLASQKFEKKAQDVIAQGTVNKPIVAIEKIYQGNQSSERIDLVASGSDVGGLMLYTSGTTSRPKGVLLPQAALTAQSRSLQGAWNYSTNDRILHVLPLHHIHGVVNCLLAPLFAGSSIEFLFPFNGQAVWNRIASPFLPEASSSLVPITFFSVVPTIYSRLIALFPTLPPTTQKAVQTATLPINLRLNISGSAALPAPVRNAWTDITSGHNVLLERYGMTEVGMALSCGLNMDSRIEGSVGQHLPGVSVRLVDIETGKVIEEGEEINSQSGRERLGEIQIKGDTVFKEYWRNDEATREAFVDDGWFRTGDVAIRRGENSVYFIQGRQSADIIKTGGEKVSALEVEREMLALDTVSEVAVVGLPSDAWGQKVAAIVVLSDKGKAAGRNGKAWSALDMRRAMKERLATYKIPQEMRVVDEIPRNAMGKVNKAELKKVIFPS